MRTARDAVLSVRWYLVDVLAPQPQLLEIAWAADSWTPIGRQVKGAYGVDARTWAFLVGQFSASEEVVVDGTDTWKRRWLLEDPLPAAQAAGIQLPSAASGDERTLNSLFVAEEEWEIRESGDKGMLNLPLALVLPVGDLTPLAGSAYTVQYTQPLEVHCYPVPQATVDESMIMARQVEDRLQVGFRLHGVGLGRPLRVPLWDFDDVDDGQSESFYRVDHDYLRLVGFSTTLIPEEDRRQIRVVASMTLGWRRAGAIPKGPLTKEVRQKYVVSE